ncbi:RNA polymerase sigma factor [Sphingomonas sp. Leaf21]|uniref:RNA polymerase sigma factor n=1 Tax=Sphingomonas sp. Leaf21 TaxID=2876550 RepID=UPI001E38C884|nr:RNA polymerase sigma factor [Sphingomonas sp. Leaf21]
MNAAGEAMLAQHGFLKAYIAKRIRSPQDVEDYVQDVYVRVMQATPPPDEIRNWRGILGRVASSVIVDRHRRDTARRREGHVELAEDTLLIADPLADPEATAIRRARLTRVEDTLAQVDACCRQAFVMARVEGLSHKDVAARLAMPVVAVGRCIEKIVARLARREADDDRAD